jgi:hypothetical protein
MSVVFANGTGLGYTPVATLNWSGLPDDSEPSGFVY